MVGGGRDTGPHFQLFVLLRLSPEAKVQFEPGAHSQVSLVLFEGYPPAQRAAGSSSADPGRAGEIGGQGQLPPLPGGVFERGNQGPGRGKEGPLASFQWQSPELLLPLQAEGLQTCTHPAFPRRKDGRKGAAPPRAGAKLPIVTTASED